MLVEYGLRRIELAALHCESAEQRGDVPTL
jgi:hypothetical protein